MTDTWTPISLGRTSLPHRLAMAPMTRSRAHVDGTPGPFAAQYYRQRASMGLLISEGTQPSDDGQGYLTTPDIYTDAHVDGWREIADAVHAEGGKLAIQLMHVGRMSHPSNTPHGRQPVAPSAIAPGVQMFTATGMLDIPTPRALETREVEQTVADFASSARRAIEAGADAVEIHGANGYIVHQFLAPNANSRTDRYGGSVENRARLAVEIAQAIAGDIGTDRTGIRLSPGVPLSGIEEGGDNDDVYRYLAEQFDRMGLAFIHMVHGGNEQLLADIRDRFSGRLIVNRPGRTREQIGSDVEAGIADMESIGVMSLSNPDLVARLKSDAELNGVRKNLFYGGGAEGYVDYPSLENG